jgi:hypothetical protein
MVNKMFKRYSVAVFIRAISGPEMGLVKKEIPEAPRSKRTTRSNRKSLKKNNTLYAVPDAPGINDPTSSGITAITAGLQQTKRY